MVFRAVELSPEKSVDLKSRYDSGVSIRDLTKEFGHARGTIKKLLAKMSVVPRTREQFGRIMSKAKTGCTPWNKGKTGYQVGWMKGLHGDSRVIASVRAAAATTKSRGSLAGKNNPMYGRTTHTKAGFRIDLGHSVRSSWEANFSRILKSLNLDYQYEPCTFELSGDRTYTPDFYVPAKGKFYEIKGFNRRNSMAKFLDFQREYPDKKIVLIPERGYRLLIRLASYRTKIEDGFKTQTRDEIIALYSSWMAGGKKRNVSQFCKDTKVSRKTIIKIFGSCSAFSDAAEGNESSKCL